jgi:hypothetical protein
LLTSLSLYYPLPHSPQPLLLGVAACGIKSHLIAAFAVL